MSTTARGVVDRLRAIDRVSAVRDARITAECAEAALHERIREAAEAGASERKLAEASGISRMTVRRVLGRG